MIPKIIHYVWFGDQTKKPIERINSWKKKLPDFEFKEWNETNLDVNRHKLSSIAYKLGKYGPASDFLRPDILYENGGVWLDTDVIIHENIEPFLNYSFFIGYEEVYHLNIGTFGSEAEHPILKKVIQWIKDNSDNMNFSKEMSEYEFLTIYMRRVNLVIAISGALKVLYDFMPNGKSTTLGNVRIESSPVFTIRGDYGAKNYIEHLYEGSWRSKFDYVSLLKEAYEKHKLVNINIWEAVRRGIKL